MTTMPAPKHHDVVVIGAGFGGLGMGIELKRQGRDDFIIVEKDAGVGGTWHANRYPGAACDIPSLLYSFSFAPTSAWTQTYPGQAEIERYLNDCVERFDLTSHLNLRTEIISLDWNADTQRWAVKARRRDGTEMAWTARIVVNATGVLSRPSIPDLPGLDDFKGTVMHTARWQPELNLTGRRIGVVGTGASSIQVVPQLVDKAARVVLFQRTPAWILPKRNRVRPQWLQWTYDNLPGAQRFARAVVYAIHEMRVPGFTWRPAILRAMEPFALRFLEKQVQDPALREALNPRYRMGCKRILISSDFYPAIQRRNAQLVSSSIARVVTDGVVTADGQHHALDTLVLATGFQAANALSVFPVRGRGGAHLNEAWQQGPTAYLGTTVPGFPNFFLIVGPNTGLGHNSMVFMIESQIRYVLDALARMDAAHVAAVDTRPEVAEAFNERLQKCMKRTVWSTGGCTSWYQSRDGRITTLWPGSTLAFRWHTRRFRLEDHEPLRA